MLVRTTARPDMHLPRGPQSNPAESIVQRKFIVGKKAKCAAPRGR